MLFRRHGESFAGAHAPAPFHAALLLRGLAAVPGPAQIQLRAEGRLLHIHLLGEPVVEWRSTERLCAGYTADGSLADLQIPDLARHLPAHPPGDPALRARIDALQDELLFLKTGLALVLAGVIWLLLR